jgi:hypothetical protein
MLHLELTKKRIRIRNPVYGSKGSGSVLKFHGFGTLSKMSSLLSHLQSTWETNYTIKRSLFKLLQRDVVVTTVQISYSHCYCKVKVPVGCIVFI